jgi:predicted aminopeptidase
VIVLAEWRAAERVLAAAKPDSDDERAAQATVDRLREEYRRLTAPTPPEA